MPDSLTLPSNWTPYSHIPPDDPGMLHPDAPPILAFYMTPAGLAALNAARCAAGPSVHPADLFVARGHARKAFRERLDHPMPPDLIDYITRDALR